MVGATRLACGLYSITVGNQVWGDARTIVSSVAPGVSITVPTELVPCHEVLDELIVETKAAATDLSGSEPVDFVGSVGEYANERNLSTEAGLEQLHRDFDLDTRRHQPDWWLEVFASGPSPTPGRHGIRPRVSVGLTLSGSMEEDIGQLTARICAAKLVLPEGILAWLNDRNFVDADTVRDFDPAACAKALTTPMRRSAAQSARQERIRHYAEMDRAGL